MVVLHNDMYDQLSIDEAPSSDRPTRLNFGSLNDEVTFSCSTYVLGLDRNFRLSAFHRAE